MISFTRGTAPPIILQKHHQWGVRWQNKITANPSAKFTWPTYQGNKLNHLIITILAQNSVNHCCYCDGFPLGATSLKTIDHFFPKSSSPLLSHVWDNLFIACDACQNHKLNNVPNNILRPDDPNYNYQTYFNLNYATGELIPNPTATPNNQTLATDTISFFGLNLFGRPEARLNRIKDMHTTTLPLNALPYRFV